MSIIHTKENDRELCQLCLDLARQECACCVNGYCLQTDKPCRQRLIDPSYRIEDGRIGCDWFLMAVLPLDPELNETVNAILNKERDLYDEPENDESHTFLRKCENCGRFFPPHSNRQKRCKACALEVHRKTDAEWHRRQYWRD